MDAKVDSHALEDKNCVVILYRAAKDISNAALQHDAAAARNSWRSWLEEGPSEGIGAQHAMSRVLQGWVPPKTMPTLIDDAEGEEVVDDIQGITDDDLQMEQIQDVVPVNAQEAVDDAASSWAEIWQEGTEGVGPRWPEAMSLGVPPFAVKQLRGA